MLFFSGNRDPLKKNYWRFDKQFGRNSASLFIGIGGFMWWLVAVLSGIFVFLFLKKLWKENSEGVKLNDGTAAEDEALDDVVEMEDAFF